MERPKVGVGVYIEKEGKILLGKRKNAHGEGNWCPPGGHLEFGEEVEECAKREVLEEAGIEISDLKIKTITNDVYKEENKHYITIHVFANYKSGEIKILEPDKCEEWEWFSWDEFPKNLFLPVENLLKKS